MELGNRQSIVTLLTDFGTDDWYVAQMKGSMLCVNPNVRLIDVTHNVSPQDIFSAALTLRQTIDYFPDGTVHLVVVDPGVGTSRKMLAVQGKLAERNGREARNVRMIGPDNGVLTLAIAKLTDVKLFELHADKISTGQVSNTFHGRDVFGPAAALWSSGHPIEGWSQPTQLNQSLEIPEPDLQPEFAQGCILAIDRFGNLITNIPNQVLSSWNSPACLLYSPKFNRRLEVMRTYGEASPGTLIVLAGSHDWVEIAKVQGRAADESGLRKGDLITLRKG